MTIRMRDESMGKERQYQLDHDSYDSYFCYDSYDCYDSSRNDFFANEMIS